jgi:protoporphyrinogen oxidase
VDLIIGAGVTGLSYANFCSSDYLVIEAEDEIGGYCRTIKQDGFIWDYSGHFFHFQDAGIKSWIMGRMDEHNLVTVSKRTQIYYKGHYIDFPFQKNIHQLDKAEFIDCLYDLFFRNQNEGRTFKQMLVEKFGTSICEKFLFPYNEKLYACDLDNLDRNAMGRFFPYADIDSIIRNMKEPDNSSYNSTFTYAKDGAQAYVDVLAKGVKEEKIHTGERVCKIDTQGKTVETDTSTYRYDNLISTMPLDRLLKLVGKTKNIQRYTYNKVVVLNLGFDCPAGSENHWIYFPDKDLCFYRVGFYSNIMGGNRMSMYVELGKDADEPCNDDNYYLEQVMADLRKVGLVNSQKLVSWSCVVMDPAYVHINEDCEQDKEVRFTELKASGIHSIGRYGGWRYCSIEDNIIEARKLAFALS